MPAIALEAANIMVDKALGEGRARGFAPLTAAVLDAGGHLVALKREDGASLLRPQIAIAKAWGALGMGFGGRELERRAQKMPQFFAALAALSTGNMVPVPGGVLVRDEQHRLCGAVGISGDTSVNDEVCALAGIRAAGFTPEAGD